MARCLLFLMLAAGGISFYSSDRYSLSLISYRCDFYFHGNSTTDSDAVDLLKIVESAGAVKICTNINGDRVYYVATPVSKKNEVHYFHIRGVFKTPVSEGYRWEYNPPKYLLPLVIRVIYMQSAVNASVRQDDPGFASTHGLSTALFKVLSRAWKGILASERQFDEACCSFSMLSLLSYPDIKGLRRALYSSEQKEGLKLLSVDLVEGSDSTAPYYTFSVGNTSRMWRIDFDFNGESIRIERIRGTVLASE
jgi:hypothetical protein